MNDRALAADRRDTNGGEPRKSTTGTGSMNDAGSPRNAGNVTSAADENIWRIAPLALFLSIALWATIGLATIVGLRFI